MVSFFCLYTGGFNVVALFRLLAWLHNVPILQERNSCRNYYSFGQSCICNAPTRSPLASVSNLRRLAAQENTGCFQYDLEKGSQKRQRYSSFRESRQILLRGKRPLVTHTRQRRVETLVLSDYHNSLAVSGLVSRNQARNSKGKKRGLS